MKPSRSGTLAISTLSQKCLQSMGWAVGLSGHLVEISHHQSRASWDTPSCATHSFIGSINNANDNHPFTTKQHSLLVELLLGDPSTASHVVFSAAGDPIVQTRSHGYPRAQSLPSGRGP